MTQNNLYDILNKQSKATLRRSFLTDSNNLFTFALNCLQAEKWILDLWPIRTVLASEWRHTERKFVPRFCEHADSRWNCPFECSIRDFAVVMKCHKVQLELLNHLLELKSDLFIYFFVAVIGFMHIKPIFLAMTKPYLSVLDLTHLINVLNDNY